MINPELLHAGELVGYGCGVLALIIKIGGPLAKIARLFQRMLDIFHDYPPHRHDDDHISYPHDFARRDDGHAAD